MPHVVVEQAGPLEVVFAALDPFVVVDGNLILRISDVFLNRRGTIMLREDEPPGVSGRAQCLKAPSASELTPRG